MAQTESARLLTPLGLLGALGVAAAVWFVPLPGTGGPAKIISVGFGDSGSDEKATVQAVGSTPDHNWLELEAPLSELREPVIKPEDDDPGPIPLPPPVRVRYLGFVSAGEDRSAALLDINGTQRFVSVGDTVSLDNRDDLVIDEITAEKVVYSIGVASFTETRSTGNGSLTPNAPAEPATPPNEDRLSGRVSLR